jgi:hypothetical protein
VISDREPSIIEMIDGPPELVTLEGHCIESSQVGRRTGPKASASPLSVSLLIDRFV